MRRAMWLCVTVTLALALSAFGLELQGTEVEGSLRAGYHAMGHDGNLVQVGEYESVSSGGDLNADLRLLRETAWGAMMVDAHARYWEEDDKDYAVDLDLARMLRFSYSYDEFPHRLRHDELFADQPRSVAGELVPGTFPPEGLTAYNPVYTATGEFHGAQSWKHEDLEVGRDYQILRSEETFSVQLAHPLVPGFQPFFRYRKEERRGFRQVTWLNGKCGVCHVMGDGKRIDERTADYEAGFSYRWGALSVEYRHLERRYDDHASAVFTTFDSPPSAKMGVFGPRLQYTASDGAQPVAYRPSVDKHLDSASLRLTGLPFGSTFFLSYTASEVENTHRDEELGYGGDKQLKYQGVSARLASSLLGHRLRLSLRARYFTLDNDDVRVIPRQTAYFASTQPVYSGVYPNDFAFTRRSVANRNDWLVGLEASYRLAPGWLLRGSYTHERKDRDYQQEYLADEDTDLDRVEAELAVSRVPFVPGLRGRLAYRYESRQDPFENHQGICQRYRDDLSQTPYYQIFRNRYRTRDATDVPSDLHQVRLHLSYPWSEALSGDFHLKYTNEHNADSGWEGRTVVLGPTITFTPGRTLSFVAGYTCEISRYQTRQCVDLFGG